MGKKNKDYKIIMDYYSYRIGPFTYVPGEPPMNVIGVKGQDNRQHTSYDIGEKKMYNGHGGYVSIPLGQLDLNIRYIKGDFTDWDFSTEKGEYTIDTMHFIKRDIVRNNGDEIKRFTPKLTEKLNIVCVADTTSYHFKPNDLPPDVYHSLLRWITNITDLKRKNDNYVVIGAATCVDIDDTGKGIVVLYNNEEYTLPNSKLGGARIQEKGELVYPDNQKDFPGLHFRPYR